VGQRKDGTHSAGNPHLRFRVSKEIKQATERSAKNKGMTVSGYLKKILVKELKASGEIIED